MAIKIISGGQTGVDQAALRAALNTGLEIGGWCPPGRLCENGLIPDEFPLEETPKDESQKTPGIPRSLRTEWNVRDSDATCVFRTEMTNDQGSKATIQFAKMYNKPLKIIVDFEEKTANELISWLIQNEVDILNIAGPAESVLPGIGKHAYFFLRKVLNKL